MSLRTLFAAFAAGSVISAATAQVLTVTSKADVYEPVARAHLQQICIVPRADRAADGSAVTVYDTRARYRVPALVEGIAPVEIEYLAPTDLDTLPTIFTMIDSRVTPLVAQQAGLSVATQ